MSLDEQRELIEAAERETEGLEERVREVTAALDAAEDELMELRDAVRAMLTAFGCDLQSWGSYGSMADAAELLEVLVTP
jgi:hypothetical protein